MIVRINTYNQERPHERCQVYWARCTPSNDLGSGQNKKLVPLVPGVATFGAHYSPYGKSVVYPVASRGEITFYRQVIQDEKPLGKPQAALKLPFTFPLFYQGNAFDFSRDLSTIVYARPRGQADFYLLSQK